MPSIRSVLVPVAVVWLLFHASVLTGTTAFALTRGASAADLACTCAHGGDHDSCPMHRKPVDSARCRLRSANHELALALVSVLGPLTVPVTAAEIAAVTPTSGRQGYDTAPPSDWTAPPDAPPPRA